MNGCQGVGPLLDAYHDGELGIVARARVRRHLSRCGACQHEFTELTGVGSWVRGALAAPDPDLWDGIARRLPAARPQEVASRRLRFAIPIPALGGTVLAAAVAALFVLLPTGLPETSGMVRTLDTHGRAVMVLEAADEPAIIWLMDETETQLPEEWSSAWI
jgi:anti-sigma factor RsiW